MEALDGTEGARHALPHFALLWRGAAFLALALVSLLGAWKVVSVSWVLAPLALVLGTAGLLAAWAAAIHLTGGEKFDDHPWV